MKIIKKIKNQSMYNDGVDLVLIQGQIQFVFFLTSLMKIRASGVKINPIFIIGELSAFSKNASKKIVEELELICRNASFKYLDITDHDFDNMSCSDLAEKLKIKLRSLNINCNDVNSIWFTQNWTRMATALSIVKESAFKICYGDKGNFANKKSGVVTDLCISPFVVPHTINSMILDRFLYWKGSRRLEFDHDLFSLKKIDIVDDQIGVVLLFDWNYLGLSRDVMFKWLLSVVDVLPNNIYLKFHPRQDDAEREDIRRELLKLHRNKNFLFIETQFFIEFVDLKQFNTVFMVAPLSTELTSVLNSNVKNVSVFLPVIRLWPYQLAIALYKKMIKIGYKGGFLLGIMFYFAFAINKLVLKCSQIFNEILKK